MADRRDHRQQARAAISQADDPRSDGDRRSDAEHHAREAERQRDELDQRRQHQVAEHAARSDLLEVVCGQRCRRERDPRRRRQPTHHPAAQPAAALAVRRSERQGQRGDERELERRIEQVGRPPYQDRQRRDAERIDQPQRAIEELRDQHQRDHHQRAQRRQLRPGDHRVADREHQRRRRRPARRPRPPTPRRRGDQAAQQAECQPRHHREMEATHREHMKDTNIAPALIERGRHFAAVADRDPAQRGAADRIATRAIDRARPRGLRRAGPAPRAIDRPAGITEPLEAARRDLEVGAARAGRARAVGDRRIAQPARRVHDAGHRHALARHQVLVGPQPQRGIAGVEQRRVAARAVRDRAAHHADHPVRSAIIDDDTARRHHRRSRTARRAEREPRDEHERAIPPRSDDRRRGDQPAQPRRSPRHPERVGQRRDRDARRDSDRGGERGGSGQAPGEHGKDIRPRDRHGGGYRPLPSAVASGRCPAACPVSGGVSGVRGFRAKSALNNEI